MEKFLIHLVLQRRLRLQCKCFRFHFLRLPNVSTARKSGNISHILKAFFVRHSSEYEMSDSDERLSRIYIASCGYAWLDESKWPQEWPISPITIIYLKIPSEKMKYFCLHRTRF